MLASLNIRNFILIQDALLEFGEGLTVLTGETGAGKTLLTRALGLLMGERAEEGLVGPAAQEASIEAVFSIDRRQLQEVPEQIRDLFEEGQEELIVTRRLSREGRNRCYVNGAAVTLGALSEVLSRLLSFAGQHEYRRLLDPAYQLAVLDEWAGPEAVELGRQFRQSFLEAKATVRALEEAERSRETRERELRLLRYELEELERAGLSVGEEESLTSEQRLLARAEELLTGAGLAAELLSAQDDALDAAGLLAQASSHLARLAGIDEALDGLADDLVEVQYRLSELSRELRSHLETIGVDPERLETVESRLRLYSDLGRKYGGSTRAALEHLERARHRLTELEQTNEDLERMTEARAARCALALDLAAELSAARRRAAPLLEETVAQQLSDLGMPEASLHVALQARPGWDGLREDGAESVEFLLAANLGQPARKLAATASGGELSRVLLALKCALAGAGGDETLVFDEIDAGIGGRTAVAVAGKLRELSCRSQLAVVTHLASVAALADRHYLIEKVSEGGPSAPGRRGAAAQTTTRLSLLDEEGSVVELCRMMGGRPGDVEAMAHARRLRDSAQTSC